MGQSFYDKIKNVVDKLRDKGHNVLIAHQLGMDNYTVAETGGIFVVTCDCDKVITSLAKTKNLDKVINSLDNEDRDRYYANCILHLDHALSLLLK